MKIMSPNVSQPIDNMNVAECHHSHKESALNENSYKEKNIPELGITVKYNPEVSDQQAEISIKSVSVDRLVENKTAMTTNALHKCYQCWK